VPIDLYVSKITNPGHVWSIRIELLLEVIFARTIIFMYNLPFGLIGRHFRKFHRVYQAVYSADIDTYAIVTLKDILDFVST